MAFTIVAIKKSLIDWDELNHLCSSFDRKTASIYPITPIEGFKQYGIGIAVNSNQDCLDRRTSELIDLIVLLLINEFKVVELYNMQTITKNNLDYLRGFFV